MSDPEGVMRRRTLLEVSGNSDRRTTFSKGRRFRLNGRGRSLYVCRETNFEPNGISSDGWTRISKLRYSEVQVLDEFSPLA